MEEEFNKSIELLKKHKQYIIQKIEGQDTLEAKNQYINQLNEIDEKLFRYYKNKIEIANLNFKANKTKIRQNKHKNEKNKKFINFYINRNSNNRNIRKQ